MIRLRFKTLPVLIMIVVSLATLGALLLPRSVSAEAGPGGGGGGSGCGSFAYTTCVGAVWRYYTSTSNDYPIKNSGAGTTHVTNCGSTGGFFAYVLVNKNSPHDAGQVRSWQIGPAGGVAGNRSIFFPGGWTNYRIYSVAGVPAPTNPSDGEYTWYQAKAAFLQTKTLGQNSGYEWDANSHLGWFCYKGLNYNLTPTIGGSPTSAEGGETIGLKPNVNNAGPTGSSSINWRITSFTLNPGETPPAAATNTTDPTTFFGKPGNHVTTEKNLSSTFSIVGPNPIAQQNVILGEYDVGMRVCYALSIKPYTQTAADGWRHSDSFCVLIAKRPKVQILGSDLIVGKGATSTITSGSTRKTVSGAIRTYGSWGEYGVIASGLITGFASGGGYSGGNTGTGTADVVYCAASLLTFTSAGTSTCTATGTTKGSYPLVKQLPDIAGRFVPKLDITGNTVNVTGAAGTYVYGKNISASVYPGPTITVNSSPGTKVAKGRSVIIVAPTATVNITSNIDYVNDATPQNVLHRASDIPQVIIIADKINIDASVTNVDAWLIATGTVGSINTCAQVNNPATQLNSETCKEKLTVNGPVVSKHLYLYRTAGSDPAAGSGNAAEVFNLRPDAYLWATNYSASAGKLQTVSTKELPPRF